PPAAKPFDPPAAKTFDPPAAKTFNPPAARSFDPPAAKSFEPPFAKHHEPPAPKHEPVASKYADAPLKRHESGATLPKYVAPPLDLAQKAHGIAPAMRAGVKKRWPLLAAAAVIVAAAVSLPAARRLVSGGTAQPEGTLVVNTNPPGARLFVDGVER